MDVTLTCIIPTVGRDSLYRAVESCRGCDEIIVVVDEAKADGWKPERLDARVMFVESCDRGGHSSRNFAMPHATGSHLVFLDDDDIFLPGAIDLFRQHACDVPVIFRMDDPVHGCIWRNPELTFGNVSTQMWVVPNIPDKLGQWIPHMPGLPQPGGDFTFITQCVEKMGGPVWRDDLIAVIKPGDRRTVSVVTPWHNHHELADDYQQAIWCGGPDEVIVVDNGSNPPVDFPGIRNHNNAGFPRACNQGLAAATSDVVLFLNNDIEMIRPNWLRVIRDAVEPGVLVGASLRYEPHADVDGQQFPYLDGWCVAGMRDDFLELGGWDESLAEPAYYSDNLLSLNARLAGMTLREVDVGLLHKLNVTAGPATDDKVRRASEINRRAYVDAVRDALVAA